MVAAAVGEGAGLPAPPPGLGLQVHVVDGGGVVLVLVRHHCTPLLDALLDSLLDALTDTLTAGYCCEIFLRDHPNIFRSRTRHGGGVSVWSGR